MPGIFLTTNIFAHVGGFFYALMSWGEAAQICFLPCAQRSEGAVITQPAERAECASERMVTDGYGAGYAVCRPWCAACVGGYDAVCRPWCAVCVVVLQGVTSRGSFGHCIAKIWLAFVPGTVCRIRNHP